MSDSIPDLKQALAAALDAEASGGPEARAKVGRLSAELAHRLGTWSPYPRPLR